jgi:NAD(P)-dependent dehydrogenase (short-subunit alcohol dehydrogenase family)
MTEAATEAQGLIDIPVNNAGTGQSLPFAMMEDEQYDGEMEVNVRSILHITSIMSPIADQGRSVHNTVKGAARMRTRGMAVDLSG